MYAEMSCGFCDSVLSIDSEDDGGVWALTTRFATAHADCGYMTPLAPGDGGDSTTKKIIRPRLTGDSEES